MRPSNRFERLLSPLEQHPRKRRSVALTKSEAAWRAIAALRAWGDLWTVLAAISDGRVWPDTEEDREKRRIEKINDAQNRILWYG